MNIDRFKHDHERILEGIAALRALSHDGIAENAAEIARRIVAMSSVIKLHLSAEDRVLYPELQASGNRTLAMLGWQFQQEMNSIAAAYVEFARRWNTPERVHGDPAGFRLDANRVLKAVHERMQRENRDFYPVIERHAGPLRQQAA
ncbi:MAG: hemerythrin [Burkholderiales bacterium]|jgi:iron-sulfur cluster repair protein YtfE (RIC family)|nr:MAG: hemerythrin [Burkholderiales bacterium]